ncbi:MAG: TPM domain-containing protein [Microbacter sp.]
MNDLAGLFTPSQSAFLERKLVNYNDSTSTQIAVVTVSNLHGYQIDDFTDQLAEKWGVGRKGVDNGLMILIKPKTSNEQGYVRISVGYGLESTITDAISSQLIHQIMIPAFQQQQYFQGVDSATNVIIGLCSGLYKPDQLSRHKTNYFQLVILLILLVIFLLSFLRRNHFHTIGSSGAGGGAPFIFFPFFGGGGNFEGNSGGDSFGGFGGFGGGSFGGGGASGSW